LKYKKVIRTGGH